MFSSSTWGIQHSRNMVGRKTAQYTGSNIFWGKKTKGSPEKAGLPQYWKYGCKNWLTYLTKEMRVERGKRNGWGLVFHFRTERKGSETDIATWNNAWNLTAVLVSFNREDFLLNIYKFYLLFLILFCLLEQWSRRVTWITTPDTQVL